MNSDDHKDPVILQGLEAGILQTPQIVLASAERPGSASHCLAIKLPQRDVSVCPQPRSRIWSVKQSLKLDSFNGLGGGEVQL